jgi:Zn-dependent protease with chaperone function
MSLKAGKEALLRKHYTEAIALLREYIQDHPDIRAKDYIQAQMFLVRAYQGVGRPDKAIPICEGLMLTGDPQLQDWARRSLISLREQLAKTPDDRIERNEDVASVAKTSARRYATKPVVLALPQINTWLFGLAMAGTVALILGVTFSIGLMAVLPFYLDGQIPDLLFYCILGFTLLLSVILFFMSPWISDITQKQYQRTQWITLADLEPRSPEAVETIELFCERYKYLVPRLGWIDSPVPIAFSYGILPNSARIVVSKGLFDCLDDDEIAAVFAYHLGRIATWSFSVITYASAPLQILYLIYVLLSRASFRAKTGNSLIRLVANCFFLLYGLGNYCLCFLTRRSTPLCDRFAAEMTANPNAITRALVKMSRGLLEHHELGSPPNRLLDSTRALGFLDYRTSTAIGMAWQVCMRGRPTITPTK